MTGTDIHPEDLLDKMAAGTLSESEHEHLMAHLNGCEVCRFTLEVQNDLELEATGLEFGRVSAQRLLGLTATGLAGTGLTSPGHAGAGLLNTAPSPRPKGARPRRPVLLAVGIIAMASGAAALVGSGQLPWTGASVAQVSAQPPRVVTAPSRGAPPREKAPKAEPQPVAEAPAAATGEKHRAPAHVAASQTATSEPTARDLFAQANEARRNGDSAQATQLYHKLQRSFPTSTEAQLSLVTLGRLQLDSGNAGAALSTFNRYLARGGRPLEAEALYGRALALGRLGMSDQEQKAWQTLASKHPGSGYADTARERLRALAAR